MNFEEPKTWADVLKQKESERNQPPPKDAYIRQSVVVHQDAGIFPDSNYSPDPNSEKDNVFVDTHFYSTTQIFDDDEPKKIIPKPNHDHGNEPFIWHTKTKYERAREDKTSTQSTRLTHRDIKTRDFDMITGVPYENGFKSTIKRLLEQKEKSNTFRLNRSFDPVSNTFPTAELESTRLQGEALAHQNNVTYHLNRMPETIQRAENGTLNIITGECSNDESLKAINEFRNSSLARGQQRWARESQIVNSREIQRNKEIERIGCRFNNGRSRMLRDYNIINSNPEQHQLDASVRNKPSVWQWCQTERIET